MKRALVALSLLALAGCIGVDKKVNAWVGKPEQDLLYAWGAPTRTSELPDGRKVLTYHQGADMGCEAIFRLSPTGIVQSVDIGGRLGGCEDLLAAKRGPAG